jgi:tryptophan synthase alpha chain
MSRLSAQFADLAAQNRAALVVFVSAGDPDLETSKAILAGLPKAGADIIELGMPFTDPMADGPSIQLGSKRALEAGASMARTLEMAQGFRAQDQKTPLVLMGYYNPIYIYGAEKFCQDAKAAGVDGVIVVDLPPEEAGELLQHLRPAGIDFIFLATPTSDDQRLPVVLGQASGFVYYVSVTGTTGGASASEEAVKEAMIRLRRHTALPVAIGFGIKTPSQAAQAARHAEAVVVGSAVVDRIAQGLDGLRHKLVEGVLSFVAELAQGVRQARK